MNTEDLVFETRQDPKVVEKVLSDLGFTGSTVETHSDEGGQVPAPETPAAEAPPAEPAAAEPVAAEPVAPAAPKPSSGYKKKWEVTTAENERLKQELELARKPAAAAAPVAEPAATSAEPEPAVQATEEAKPKPKPENYENGVYDPQFVEDLSDWKYDDRQRIEREKVTTTARETEAQARKDSDARDQTAFNTWWTNQIEEAKARHTDFDVAVAKQHDVDITNDVMNQAMRTTKRGAELAYWLATHPQEASVICQATKFNKGETIVDWNEKLALAVVELAKIELPDTPVIAEEEDPIEETQPAAQPVAAAAAAAAAPAPSNAAPAPRAAPTPASVKPAPPNPVGSGARSTSPVKRLSQMTQAELAAHLAKFPSDPTAEYRRLKKAEFGN